jgi:hypothetical protein
MVAQCFGPLAEELLDEGFVVAVVSPISNVRVVSQDGQYQ